MANVKTTFTNVNVTDFLESLTNEQMKQDSYYLISLMEKVTGVPAEMFGPTIVGFGQYHYQYESGHKGDAPILGFSPRKAAISLYVFTGLQEHEHLLDGLGKFKTGKACIYAKKMSDINEDVLIKLMKASIDFISERYQRIR